MTNYFSGRHRLATSAHVYRRLVVFVGASLVVGCESKNTQVHFVLPNDFVGFFVIKADPKAEPVQKSSAGGCVITVPETGVVVVRDAAFLGRWHTSTVTYRDGRTLRLWSAAEDSGGGESNEVFLNEWFANSEGETWFVVASGRVITFCRDEPWKVGTPVAGRRDFAAAGIPPRKPSTTTLPKAAGAGPVASQPSR